jgi:hypothetical protein
MKTMMCKRPRRPQVLPRSSAYHNPHLLTQPKGVGSEAASIGY